MATGLKTAKMDPETLVRTITSTMGGDVQLRLHTALIFSVATSHPTPLGFRNFGVENIHNPAVLTSFQLSQPPVLSAVHFIDS